MSNVNRRRYLSLWSMRGTLYYLKRINGKIDDNFLFILFKGTRLSDTEIYYLFTCFQIKKKIIKMVIQ